MRNKKPMNSGGYNQRHKPRYQGSGGGGHSSGGGQQYGHNRPRRNYGASREKYLQQARDAMAAGDRVLAENYLQHAEHCYRMMVEENANRPQPRPQQAQVEGGEAPQQNMDGNNHADTGHDFQPGNTGALPAFITGGYDQQQKPAEQPPVQNWEERDEA